MYINSKTQSAVWWEKSIKNTLSFPSTTLRLRPNELRSSHHQHNRSHSANLGTVQFSGRISHDGSMRTTTDSAKQAELSKLLRSTYWERKFIKFKPFFFMARNGWVRHKKERSHSLKFEGSQGHFWPFFFFIAKVSLSTSSSLPKGEFPTVQRTYKLRIHLDRCLTILLGYHLNRFNPGSPSQPFLFHQVGYFWKYLEDHPTLGSWGFYYFSRLDFRVLSWSAFHASRRGPTGVN